MCDFRTFCQVSCVEFERYRFRLKLDCVSERLIDRPAWVLTEIEGCPAGTLFGVRFASPLPRALTELLLPEEQALLQQVPLRRRPEWVAGRLCLAAAIKAEGGARTPMLTRPSGAPGTSSQIAGSISHKEPLGIGLASRRWRRVGADVEHLEDRDERLARRVLTAKELRLLDAERDENRGFATTCLFSLKEAVFKALSGVAAVEYFESVEASVPRHWLFRQDWVAVSASIDGSIELAGALMVRAPWVVAVVYEP